MYFIIFSLNIKHSLTIPFVSYQVKYIIDFIILIRMNGLIVLCFLVQLTEFIRITGQIKKKLKLLSFLNI